jgi:hypothetical protein
VAGGIEGCRLGLVRTEAQADGERAGAGAWSQAGSKVMNLSGHILHANATWPRQPQPGRRDHLRKQMNTRFHPGFRG